MDSEMRRHAQEAITQLDQVLERGPDVQHAEVHAAANAVIAFRNRAIERHREGSVSNDCLDQANSLVSLVYGAEFPLSGLHRDRFEQTRHGMQRLIQQSSSAQRRAPGETGTP